MATIDDFLSLGLKAAKVLEAERVQGSEKLLVLKVDIGGETRQIVAGIGKRYEPSSLVGKTIIVATLLEPRTLMGLESQGMLLAADREGEPVLLKPEEEVESGTIIK
ncbi:MAG: methionine--tRNA ligase [bacterium]|nr:methionine--tRNA ligase [bacterium]